MAKGPPKKRPSLLLPSTPMSLPAIRPKHSPQRGGDVLLDALTEYGIPLLFGNPGTTESPLMDRLADHPELRYVLALHESVALGAAHYYAQSTGVTGVVNLHVAPGLGNALGMLYNAWEANTPMVITAGQQDTRSRLREPLLGHDLVAMAEPLVKWSVQVERADEFAPILHRAFKVAHDPPAGPVFVALPLNVLEEETAEPVRPLGDLYRAPQPEAAAVARMAEALSRARRPAIVIGDGVARSGGQQELVALAEFLGAGVYPEGLMQRLNFPQSHPCFRPRMPLNHAGIQHALGGADVVLLVGGSFFEEVWFDPDSPFGTETAVLQIEDAPGRLAFNFAVEAGMLADPRAGLAALRAELEESVDSDFRAAAAERMDRLRTASEGARAARQKRLAAHYDDAPMSPARLMSEVAKAVPDDAVIVNESITAGGDLLGFLPVDDPDRYCGTRGGGIGQGLVGGIGASLAHPERPVIVFSGDGSAMYSIQALWTAAHYDMPIVFLILHNREYKILKINMDVYRERFGIPADRPYPHMNLTEPELDFVEMAAGMGVPGRKVEDPADVEEALREAFATGGPYLLDVIIGGRI